MPTIKLPDGKDFTFQSKVTGLEVAEKISKSLSKQALVVSVDGQLKDLTHTIEKDCSIKILTSQEYELYHVESFLNPHYLLMLKF